MKQIFGIVILTFFMTLNAQESYPELFAQQGTPLYKAVGSFESLDKVPDMKLLIVVDKLLVGFEQDRIRRDGIHDAGPAGSIWIYCKPGSIGGITQGD